MKIEAKLFEILTVFFILVAIVYGVFTAMSRTGIEWAGLTAIILSAGLSLIVGTYFRFVARRLDTRPEDYEEAEISDGSGDLGFLGPDPPAGFGAFAVLGACHRVAAASGTQFPWKPAGTRRGSAIDA